MKFDLTGRRFGRLLVLQATRATNNRIKWDCQCDCGLRVEVYSSHLRSGSTTSCGCRNSEVIASRNRAEAKHGMWRSNEFAIWQNILSRCHNPSNARFAQYGGRGINVCEVWRADFMAFYQHIGPRPSTSHSVDRIDNSKGYEPGNVRWATATEQARNRRNNVVTEINGERLTATDVCRIHGLNFKSVTRLIRAGHTGDEVLALATPVRRRA